MSNLPRLRSRVSLLLPMTDNGSALSAVDARSPVFVRTFVVVTKGYSSVLDQRLLPLRHVVLVPFEYFEQLFQILDFGGDLAELAWNLIIRLPTS